MPLIIPSKCRSIAFGTVACQELFGEVTHFNMAHTVKSFLFGLNAHINYDVELSFIRVMSLDSGI